MRMVAVDEKLGNPREAAQFYQGAIDTSPDNLRARTALGRLYAMSRRTRARRWTTVTAGLRQASR
jgi:hypothetical protein